ncbi:hypothetical protein ACWGID_08985 [Kribbella sp. NPDC054772]
MRSSGDAFSDFRAGAIASPTSLELSAIIGGATCLVGAVPLGFTSLPLVRFDSDDPQSSTP